MTTTPAPASRLFTPLIGVTTLLILVQGITAGIFMALRRNGGEGWVVAHDILANVTVLAAVAVAIVGLVAVRRTQPSAAWGAVALAVLLIVQTLIGHLMADAKVGALVSVHVPLAMLTFGTAIWLSVRTARPRG